MRRIKRTRLLSVMVCLGLCSPGCGSDKKPGTSNTDQTTPDTTATPAGGTYAAPLDVVLTANEAATIYYTTDGTPPTTNSSHGPSPTTVFLTESCTLTFFAVDTAGNIETAETEWYTLDDTTPQTTADPTGGPFNAAMTVALTANETATIYYTTDNSEPTTESSSGESPLDVTIPAATTVLKFRAVDAVGNTEAVQTETYTFDDTAPTSTAAPTEVLFNAAMDVTVTANETATIYYTTDGTPPTTSASHADSPATIPIPAATTTVRFYAMDLAGNEESPAQSVTYTFDDVAPTIVSFAPTAGQTSVGVFANVTFRFSESMDRSSVEGALTIGPHGGSAVDLDFVWYVDGNEEVLVAWPADAVDARNVNTQWNHATLHDISLATTAADMAGNVLAAAHASSFTTSDNRAPNATLIPTPSQLANSTPAEISITFDQNMDTGRGAMFLMGDGPMEPASWVGLSDPQLSWDGQGLKLTLIPAGPAPWDDFVLVMWTDLVKQNGDRVPTVYQPLYLDATGSGDTTPPVIDSPLEHSPAVLDPRHPFLFFSEVLDPQTVAGNVTSTVGIDPKMGFGRMVWLSTDEMTPGTPYTITLGTDLADAAGNSLGSPQTLEVQIPTTVTSDEPTFFGLADSATGWPISDLMLFLDLPAGVDRKSIDPGDIRIEVAGIGEPIRGLRFEPVPAFMPGNYHLLTLAPGSPALDNGTTYTVTVEGLTRGSGIELFPTDPLSVSFTTVSAVGNSRPVFDGNETHLDLSNTMMEGLALYAQTRIIDDDPSGVSIWITEPISGTVLVNLTQDGSDPSWFEIAENDQAIIDPGFVDGWNDLLLIASDGLNQVSVTVPVFFVSPTMWAEFTSPYLGTVITDADIPTFTLDWIPGTSEATGQLLMVAEVGPSGDPIPVLYTFLDPLTGTYPVGERIGSLFQQGSDYYVILSTQVHRTGFQPVGEGTTLTIFSVQDPTLGSIGDTVSLSDPTSDMIAIMLFDQVPGEGVDPITATYAQPTTGNDYSYLLANLDDGTYYVALFIDDDGEPDADSIIRYYGAPDPIVVSGGNSRDDIDFLLDNKVSGTVTTVNQALPAGEDIVVLAYVSGADPWSGDPPIAGGYAVDTNSNRTDFTYEIPFLPAGAVDIYSWTSTGSAPTKMADTYPVTVTLTGGTVQTADFVFTY